MGVLQELGGLKYIRLANGRRICYREQGVHREEAKRQLMVLHGLGSSRFASMPGVSDTLLKAYGVKIVAIDRPGYGRSDCDKEQTFKSTVQDIEEVADALCMGDKFWLLGYSCGGAFCWACARYIPHRLAGIGLWAPAGNYYWKGITDEERSAMWNDVVYSNKFIFGLGRRIPSWLLRLYTRHFIKPGSHWLKRLELTLATPDKQHLLIYGPDGSLISVLVQVEILARKLTPSRQPAALRWLTVIPRDNVESMTWNNGFGMAKDIELLKSDWGFEPEDVAGVYKGPFHIWQGVEDNLIPVGLQRCVKSIVPALVHLYELPNEGHLSWFCFNPKAHHIVFETLFGEDIPLNEDQVVKEED